MAIEISAMKENYMVFIKGNFDSFRVTRKA